MKFPTYSYRAIVTLGLLCFMTACKPGGETDSDSQEATSHFQALLSSEAPTVTPATGSSVINKVTVNTINAEQKELSITLASVSMMQLVIHLPKDATVLDVDVTVNGKAYTTIKVNRQYIVSDEVQYIFGSLNIQRDHLKAGVNKVGLKASGSLEAATVKLLPREIYADENGVLTTTLYTQFAKVDSLIYQNTGTKADPKYEPLSIWTRAYGLSRGVQMLPGPTLRFKPGNLVQVNIVNEFNPIKYSQLDVFDNVQNTDLGKDEELAGMTLHGELNIPHNLNNTNLHVHGLHVDPSKDDVTTVIVPDGLSTEDYDAPDTDEPVVNLDSLNEYSVSDQSVKAGNWNYQYKIPVNHLPGTHWFHPHKHGATSAQVENGMAGTIVIEESQDNSIIEYTDQKTYDAWSDQNDRVFAIQEITNYGFQRGEGDAMGINHNDSLTLTVNGLTDYSYDVAPGEMQRWRLVNAGTNHKSFAYVWLGRQDATDKSTFYVEPIYLVAADGITFAKMDTITAEKPALLAPGNRSDFLVKLSTAGTYKFFKNYPTDITLKDAATGKTLYSKGSKQTGFLPATVNGKNNPLMFKYQYSGFSQPWVGGSTNVVPLIQVKESSSDADFLDVKINTSSDFGVGNSGFQPYGIVSGQQSPAVIMTVNVTGDAVDSYDYPSKERMKMLSPITMDEQTPPVKPPSYVSPISKSDILQSRPVIFDVSGIRVKLTQTDGSASSKVNQFTLNGRFFVLNDPLGNPKAEDFIQTGFKTPSDLAFNSSTTHAHTATPVNDADTIGTYDNMAFEKSGGVQWPNTNQVVNPPGDTSYYFMNPGYFQTITEANGKYTWTNTNKPSWKALTGIDGPALVNKKYEGYSSSWDLPGLPRATTAEEYYLINNSDVGHPFHIHINPFFVVEVGQLSYETNPVTGSKDWYVRAQTASSEPQRPTKANAKSGDVIAVEKGKEIGIQGFVGNWWDTITIPPHGYVKVRYWVNVPKQNGTTPGAITVTDDDNRRGIWVYHCHILRHEDRGMMMPYVTSPFEGKKD
ncbi:MAG: multicopper oxidase domain-containing protein [Cytophagales bacterium]|nr:multicopper oxidase domain-containing protein [Cytophagales bacterium]